MEENLMTPDEVCTALGVSRTTLNQIVKAGSLGCIRLSPKPKAHRRFRPADVRAFKASGAQTPPAETQEDFLS